MYIYAGMLLCMQAGIFIFMYIIFRNYVCMYVYVFVYIGVSTFYSMPYMHAYLCWHACYYMYVFIYELYVCMCIFMHACVHE